MTSNNNRNQSFSPCLPYGTKGPGHDRNLKAKPFQKHRGRRAGRSFAEDPFTVSYHEWPRSKALQWKSAPPVLLHTSPPPLSHKCLTEPQIRETDLSPVSCLLASRPGDKAPSFLKSRCHSIGFCAPGAVSARKESEGESWFKMGLLWQKWSEARGTVMFIQLTRGMFF